MSRLTRSSCCRARRLAECSSAWQDRNHPGCGAPGEKAPAAQLRVVMQQHTHDRA